MAFCMWPWGQAWGRRHGKEGWGKQDVEWPYSTQRRAGVEMPLQPVNGEGMTAELAMKCSLPLEKRGGRKILSHYPNHPNPFQFAVNDFSPGKYFLPITITDRWPVISWFLTEPINFFYPILYPGLVQEGRGISHCIGKWMLTRVNLPHYLTALLELQSGSKVMQALCSFLAENNQVYFQKKPVMSYIIGLYFILWVRMLANQNNLLNH